MIINNDCLSALKEMEDNSFHGLLTDPPYGISFMGKRWDYDVPSVELWQEVLRVLKPGAHGLVACGTRTQHRMAVNLEDAGFEIRDVITWLYGSGFPKSLNIGKAVDKIQGNEREVVGKEQIDVGMQSGSMHAGRSSEVIERDKTKGTSDWEGYGSALKPAVEFYTLVRKPIEKNIAENCLKHGCGGLDIDGCRVGLNGDKKTPGGCKTRLDNTSHMRFRGGQVNKEDNTLGRFPANLIHDGSDEVVEGFPETKPTKPHSGDGGKLDTREQGWGFKRMPCDLSDNGGSASRFFYCAKVSKSERNAGCEGMEEGEVKRQGLCGEHRNPVHCNTHPTLKPLSLCKYLAKLIKPPKGKLLVPFAGAGSEMIGAMQAGWDEIVGIEKESDYVQIAEARYAYWKEKQDRQQSLL